ncbi:hypothetical protein PVK06_041467 [Gossypium arboreum]|uniref:RRM domain-containing protein n=1 Tax=Gossypium arboreum TaxID=29729 RepID=A0ABR0N8B0_GOSAR|nr:hypothetical protein PVK06_041467 [Gossypium arboreum]
MLLYRRKGVKRFGFVRFSNMMDARRAISRLNGFVVIGNRLSVDLAKFNGGRQIWKKKRRGEANAVMGSNGKMEKKDYEKLKDTGRVERGECSSKSQFGKTNVENDNVRIEKHFIAVQGHVEEEQLWKLQRCLVGETATCCDIKNLQERIVKAGLGEIRIRRIQGRFFLVDIPDDKLFGILKQNDWGYLREFFVLIEPSLEVTMVEERNPNKASCFASMPMLVSIMKPEKVDGLIFLEVGSSRFPIRVVEKGLSEVEDVSRSLMGNNGEGCIPEGASDTVENHLVFSNRKNQKPNGRKVRSMLDIQVKVLSINEKRKRNRAMIKTKRKRKSGQRRCGRERFVVGFGYQQQEKSATQRGKESLGNWQKTWV